MLHPSETEESREGTHEEAPATPTTPVIITVTKTKGVLFLLDTEEDTAVPSSAATANHKNHTPHDTSATPCVAYDFMEQHFPQMKKKAYGWALSGEELSYLAWLASRTTTAPPAEVKRAQRCHSHGDDYYLGAVPPFTIVLASAAVREALGARQRHNPLSCALYKALAPTCLLRHGTQFGALYIGYSSTTSSTCAASSTSSAIAAAGVAPGGKRGRRMEHGERLFFLGPLSALEEVAAARVAGSVGKVAYVCLPPTALPAPASCTGHPVAAAEKVGGWTLTALHGEKHRGEGRKKKRRVETSS